MKRSALMRKKGEMKMDEDEKRDEDFHEREIKKGRKTQQLLSCFEKK